LDKKFTHTVEVVVDRLVMRDDLRRRLTDSLETATRLSDGLVRIEVLGEGGRSFTYSERFACPEHGASLPELAPRTFSFNSPHGACPTCTGLGFTLEVDPELVVDPERTLREGAVLPWNAGLMRPVALEIPPNTCVSAEEPAPISAGSVSGPWVALPPAAGCLAKPPGVAETIDWARALVTLNAHALDKETLDTTLTVLLKHEQDVQRAKRALGSGSGSRGDDDNVDYRVIGRSRR